MLEKVVQSMCNFFYPQKTPQLNKIFIFHLFEVISHDVCFYAGTYFEQQKRRKNNFNLLNSNNLNF